MSYGFEFEFYEYIAKISIYYAHPKISPTCPNQAGEFCSPDAPWIDVTTKSWRGLNSTPIIIGPGLTSEELAIAEIYKKIGIKTEYFSAYGMILCQIVSADATYSNLKWKGNVQIDHSSSPVGKFMIFEFASSPSAVGEKIRKSRSTTRHRAHPSGQDLRFGESRIEALHFLSQLFHAASPHTKQDTSNWGVLRQISNYSCGSRKTLHLADANSKISSSDFFVMALPSPLDDQVGFVWLIGKVELSRYYENPEFEVLSRKSFDAAVQYLQTRSKFRSFSNYGNPTDWLSFASGVQITLSISDKSWVPQEGEWPEKMAPIRDLFIKLLESVSASSFYILSDVKMDLLGLQIATCWEASRLSPVVEFQVDAAKFAAISLLRWLCFCFATAPENCGGTAKNIFPLFPKSSVHTFIRKRLWNRFVLEMENAEQHFQFILSCGQSFVEDLEINRMDLPVDNTKFLINIKKFQRENSYRKRLPIDVIDMFFQRRSMNESARILFLGFLSSCYPYPAEIIPRLSAYFNSLGIKVDQGICKNFLEFCNDLFPCETISEDTSIGKDQMKFELRCFHAASAKYSQIEGLLFHLKDIFQKLGEW